MPREGKGGGRQRRHLSLHSIVLDDSYAAPDLEGLLIY